MLLPTVMAGCVLPAVSIHWTMAPAAANHRPVAADCVFLQSADKKTSHSHPLLRLSYSSMKENIEDEVITLADGKTANNLCGAASIGISETDCGHTDAQCTYDSDCCYCKFICLKLETQRRTFHFISSSTLYKKLFCYFSVLYCKLQYGIDGGKCRIF
jgi:hypothetical protein